MLLVTTISGFATNVSTSNYICKLRLQISRMSKSRWAQPTGPIALEASPRAGPKLLVLTLNRGACMQAPHGVVVINNYP